MSVQVVFEAILDRGYQGDMAIDDIRVFEGLCIEMYTTDSVDNQNATMSFNSTEIPNSTSLPDN